MRLSSTRERGLADGGRQLGQPVGQRDADCRRFALAERIDEAAGQLGRGAGRDQIEQLGGGTSRSFADRRIASRRRGGRRRLGRVLLAVSENVAAIAAICSPSCWLPQRVASVATWALAAGGSLSKSCSERLFQFRRQLDFAVARPAADEAAEDGGGDFGLGLRQSRDQWSRVGRFAAGDMLGDDGNAVGGGWIGERIASSRRRRPSGTAGLGRPRPR